MPKKKKTGPNNAGQEKKIYDHRENGKPVKTKGKSK